MGERERETATTTTMMTQQQVPGRVPKSFLTLTPRPSSRVVTRTTWCLSSSQDRGGDRGASLGDEGVELLPESREALAGYSRHYKARDMKRGQSNGYGGTLGDLTGSGMNGKSESTFQDPSDFEEPIYASSRRRSNKGMIAIASVGGLVCALSLVSFNTNQSSSTRRIDRQQLTLTTLQNEVAKGTNKMFGHVRHEEAERSKLVKIQGAFRVELLRPSAANAFEQMKRAANREGIQLHLVSGFRGIQHQEELYFGVKAERVQSSRERALVPAPPGFSEHHTGYALDICDETLTLDESFASTKAYAWLQMNARAYNFELSFPERGKVAFEPWHWRFEGETEAIEAFYKNN